MILVLPSDIRSDGMWQLLPFGQYACPCAGYGYRHTPRFFI
jgi:hypothetical protein